MALPPEAVLLAAARWLRLLRRSSEAQASALVRADAAYADLSITQYAQGLEWLERIGLLVRGETGLEPVRGLASMSARELNEQLLAAALDASRPSWLQDADLLVTSAADLPQDVAVLATTLGVGDDATLLAIGRLHGKIDLEQRALVGSAGEARLVELLEERWPGSTRHVAIENDGLGYDIALSVAGTTWHLEVKTTTRRGRLVIHVSRNEHEVALRDPDWRLIAVGLDEDEQVACVATLDYADLASRAPRDQDRRARWEAVRFSVGPEVVAGGLSFLPSNEDLSGAHLLAPADATSESSGFAWMPSFPHVKIGPA